MASLQYPKIYLCLNDSPYVFLDNLRIFSGSSSVFGPGVHDPKIEKLARFRRTRSGRTGRNAARDFHRYVHRDGKTFGVHINSYKIPIRMKIRTTHGKRRRREIEVEHPLILLSQWMAAILTTFPKFFLAGVCPERDGSDAYMQIFPASGSDSKAASQITQFMEKPKKSVAAQSLSPSTGTREEDWQKSHCW